MEYLQTLASEAGMPYVNITLDVGAVINAYKYLWNNSGIFNTNFDCRLYARQEMLPLYQVNYAVNG